MTNDQSVNNNVALIIAWPESHLLGLTVGLLSK